MTLTMPRARERWSATANWSRRISFVGGLISLYGLLMHRYGLVETPAGFGLLAIGLSVAFVGLCFGVYGMFSTWIGVIRGLRHAVTGTAIAALVLAYPAYLIVPGLALPAIHDISTDLVDPPVFTGSLARRPAWANTLEHPGIDSELAAAQAEAYPDIVPLILEMQVDEAFDVARRAAREEGWTLTATLAPPFDRGEGQVEATTRTFVMAYLDDVVIRVRPEQVGTRFDVRSVSSYGRSDLGRNAARIRAVLRRIVEISER